MVSEVKELKPEHNADTVGVTFGFFRHIVNFGDFASFWNVYGYVPSDF